MTKLILSLIISLNIGSLFSQEDSRYSQILEEFYVTGPGYSAIVTKDGEVLFHDAIGLADIENDTPIQPDHVFRLGSITKQFTAIAILQLAEQGLLRLDEDITTYIPDYPTQNNKICIEHLLNHTSGIKSYTSMETWTPEQRMKDLTPSELIDMFKYEPMDFSPGDEFKYNNSGYVILGYIIERVTGRSYEDYIEKEFFEKLGMHNSHYGEPDEIAQIRAHGYAPDKNGDFINAPSISMSQPYAAGSIVSTTADLNKWNEAVFNHELVSKESLELAHESTILNDGETVNYGFGWRFNRLKGSTAINHGGGINGFETHAAYFPEEKVFVAVFSNCRSNDPGFLMRALAGEAIGKPLDLSAETSIDTDDFDAYVGVYQIDPDYIIKISEDSDRLLVQATDQSILHLFPIKKGHFRAPQIDAKFRFISKDGEIESLMIFQGGEYIAKKIE